MGHRTTYAIREHGRIELFYSHWGALSVPQDIFWGPGDTEAFIRANEPCDEWLDDVWGEGGVALDKDNRVVTWFGGDALGYPPYREVFEHLMAALWGEHGWTVRAVEEMPDIAEAVGVDRAVATAEPIDPYPIDLEELGTRWRVDRWYQGLLSIREETSVRHLVLDVPDEGFLVTGPAALDHVDRLPSLATVLEHHETRPLASWEAQAGRRAPLTNDLSTSLLVDTRARCVTIRSAYGPTRHALQCIAAAWVGWRVATAPGGAPEHFASLAQEAPLALAQPAWWGADESAQDAVEPGEDEILAEIARALLGERTDPVAFVTSALGALEADGGEDVWINPHALNSPPDQRPERGDAEAIFGRAVAAFVRTRPH